MCRTVARRQAGHLEMETAGPPASRKRRPKTQRAPQPAAPSLPSYPRQFAATPISGAAGASPRRTGGDSTGGAQTTLALQIYSKIRNEIIGATLDPGKKLRIRELCQQHGVGLSPVREALNRLSSEGLVVQTAHRGFSVASFGLQDLDELVRARLWLNELALRESIKHGDAQWEERVLIGYHRLSRLPRLDATGARNEAWDRAHRIFHANLLDACGSRWLLEFCQTLYDASERYRALARLTNDPPRDHLVEHRAIMTAVVERNEALAIKLLQDHFNRTTTDVRRSLAAAEEKARSASAPLRRGRKPRTGPV